MNDKMQEKILKEIHRLPEFGSGAVLQDEADDAEASIKMTVGDIRTIRRLKELANKEADGDTLEPPGP